MKALFFALLILSSLCKFVIDDETNCHFKFEPDDTTHEPELESNACETAKTATFDGNKKLSDATFSIEKLLEKLPSLTSLSIMNVNMTTLESFNSGDLTTLNIIDSSFKSFPIKEDSKITHLKLTGNKQMGGEFNFRNFGTFEEITINDSELFGTVPKDKLPDSFTEATVNLKINFFYGKLPTDDNDLIKSCFDGNCFFYEDQGTANQGCGRNCTFFDDSEKHCKKANCYYDDGKCTSTKPGGLSTATLAVVIAVPCFVVIVVIIIAIVIAVRRHKSNDVRAERYESEKGDDKPNEGVVLNDLQSSNVTAASVF